MNKWVENQFNHLYYNEDTGLIIGITHKLGNQNVVNIAKVYKENEEINLGQYISIEFAKKAVENYWFVQQRTFIE